jgi:hypothetical protein
MAQQKKIVTVTKATHTLNGFSRYKAQWYVSGSAATPYTVSELRNGDWECSCMAWTRNHPREDCKHIMRVKLQENTPAPALTMASTPSLAVPIYTGRKMRD